MYKIGERFASDPIQIKAEKYFSGSKLKEGKFQIYYLKS